MLIVLGKKEMPRILKKTTLWFFEISGIFVVSVSQKKILPTSTVMKVLILTPVLLV